jgi:exonuclease SbcC
MRIHHLRFSAIGPFAGTYDIDFDELGASGLFLLEGPTGAGKSTILDAIVFALYGETAGENSSSERLRSSFADPSADSWVELKFSTDSGIYQVRRSPSYDRPKRSGQGTTKQNTQVTLTRFLSPDDKVGQPESARIQEVADKIYSVIGLSRAQFTQTVVLPQGEFATFLRSDSKDRREVLQRLFGTEVYEKLQEELAGRRVAARDHRAAAEAAIGNALAAFTSVAEVDDEVRERLVAVSATPHELLRQATSVVSDLQGVVVSTSEAASAVTERRNDVKAALDAASAREVTRTKLVRLLEQQGALAAAAPTIDGKREELAAARRAQPVAVLEKSVADHAAAKEAADAALSSALAASDEDLRALDVAGTTEQRAAAHDLVIELQPFADSESGLPTREQAVADLHTRLSQKQSRLDEINVLIANAPAQRAALSEQRDRLTVLVADRGAVEQALAALAPRIVAAIQLVDALVREQVAAVATSQRRLAAVAASQHAHHLVEQRFAGMAASLAAELAPGSPCPVCGSLEHPQLAIASDVEVKADDVRAAQEAVQVATAQAEVAATAHAAASAEVARLRGLAQGDLPELQDLQSEQARQLELLDAAQVELTRVATALDTLQQDVDRWSGEASNAVAAVAGQEEEIRTAVSHLAELKQQLDTRRASFATVSARLAATRQREVQLDLLVTSHTAVAMATQALETRLAERADVLSRQQFPSIEAARTAIRDDASIAVLESELAKYRADVEGVERALADDDVKGVDPNVAEDLEPLKQVFGEVEQAAALAISAATLAANTHKLAAEKLAGLNGAVEDSRDVFAATAVTIRMADLVAASPGSANQELMPLTSFVLRERFRSVVDAANTRLRTLSDGRFELRHTEDREGGSRRTGLGLRVLDNDNGAMRDPKSLSGGETFYTSLALALGLSDEVVGVRGGITLGTLFIDEGFGSLDTDRLEDVLDVLHRLREGGRVIGVISHVAEMKEAIPARIEVRPSRGQGSAVTVRT